MVCPGTCWKSVSGGMEDARGREEEFPWYRYGGMWKVCFFFLLLFVLLLFLFLFLKGCWGSGDGEGGMFWFGDGMK